MTKYFGPLSCRSRIHHLHYCKGVSLMSKLNDHIYPQTVTFNNALRIIFFLYCNSLKVQPMSQKCCSYVCHTLFYWTFVAISYTVWETCSEKSAIQEWLHRLFWILPVHEADNTLLAHGSCNTESTEWQHEQTSKTNFIDEEQLMN